MIFGNTHICLIAVVLHHTDASENNENKAEMCPAGQTLPPWVGGVMLFPRFGPMARRGRVHVCSTGVSGVPRVKRCYDMPCMAGEENT